jgi:hypothetical protein
MCGKCNDKAWLGHRLANWQIRIAILSSPLKEKWRHFLQERCHFSLRLRVRGEFHARNPLNDGILLILLIALNDAADQQHAHSLPFRYSVGWDQQQEKRGTVLSKPAQRMNPEHLGLY